MKSHIEFQLLRSCFAKSVFSIFNSQLSSFHVNVYQSSFINSLSAPIRIKNEAFSRFTTRISTNTTDSSISIQQSVFKNCKSGNNTSGGAVYVNSHVSNVLVSHTLFFRCSSETSNGGACSINSLSIYITKSCFLQCYSSSRGNAFTSIVLVPLFQNSASYISAFQCSPSDVASGFDTISIISGMQRFDDNNCSQNSGLNNHVSGPVFDFYMSHATSYSTFYNSTCASLTRFLRNMGATIQNSNFLSSNVANAALEFVFVMGGSVFGCAFFNISAPFYVVNSSITVMKCIGNVHIDGLLDNDGYKKTSSNDLIIPTNNEWLCDEYAIKIPKQLHVSDKELIFTGAALFSIVILVLVIILLCSSHKKSTTQDPPLLVEETV